MKTQITRFILSIIFTIIFSCSGFCQIKPSLTARVDTTNKDVKAVYELLGNYFNSNPDSLYKNPYWNKAEVEYYYNIHKENFDQAATYLFFNLKAEQLFSFFPPTVLSIEPFENKYVARILLAASTVQQWMADHKLNPPFILRYYAAKDSTGNWRLENTWTNELKKWKQYKTKWITFQYPPSFEFSTARAQKANIYIDSVMATLQLKPPKPFDFYVMSSEEELARLFNMDYWLAYQTGFARKQHNRIFMADGSIDNSHEIFHMLYHPVKNHFLGEGIATYFGGVDGNVPYKESLIEVSKDLQENHPRVTFKDLYSNSFRYVNNQNPRYVAGAVVYQLVYEKKGLKGIRQLEESENTYESFIKAFAGVMNMKESKVEEFLTNYIRKYHSAEDAQS